MRDPLEIRMLVLWFLVAAMVALTAPLKARSADTYAVDAESFVLPFPDEKFHSLAGREHVVEFRGLFRTEFATLVQTRAVDRARYFANRVRPTFSYLYGPLTNRKIGAPQRGASIVVDWENASVAAQGFVELPYVYRGTWILHRNFGEGTSFALPVAYDASLLQTANWHACTDSDPDHQTIGFYWYFWDPARRGCDQSLGYHFQTVSVG